MQLEIATAALVGKNGGGGSGAESVDDALLLGELLFSSRDGNGDGSKLGEDGEKDTESRGCMEGDADEVFPFGLTVGSAIGKVGSSSGNEVGSK